MEIRETKEQKTMAIRTFTPMEKLSEVMGQSYGEIMAFMTSNGIATAGPPYAMYHNMDMSNLDVEMGFPVTAAKAGNGRIKAAKLPGGKAAVTMHTGPYDAIGETYNNLAAFMKEKGLTPETSCYEFYLNDPRETPPAELKTEIYFPLK